VYLQVRSSVDARTVVTCVSDGILAVYVHRNGNELTNLDSGYKVYNEESVLV